jgi:hypothetical protein
MSPETHVRRSSRLIYIETSASSLEGIVKATTLLKDRKAAGVDGIPTEFLKANTFSKNLGRRDLSYRVERRSYC